MGEYETTPDMFIVWTIDNRGGTNNALFRCDAYYYRWNFVSQGVINGAERVVKRDLTKTDPQVLTWAISKQLRRLSSRGWLKTR